VKYLSADCIIPITGDPCYESVLAVGDNGEIEGIFQINDLQNPQFEIKHYDGILCPGFVNTHCHLELSWAKGLIPEGRGLDSFVRELELSRKTITSAYIQKAIENAAIQMEQCGIIATADIVNGNHTLDIKNKSKHYFHTFVEIFGSNPDYAKGIFEKALQLKSEFGKHTLPGTVSIVPHATYSLSKELFRFIANENHENLLSIHHQENNDENLFFKDGSGPISSRRTSFNPGLPPFSGAGKRPLESISGHFNPDQKILLVHNTVTEQQDIDIVEHYFSQAYWSFCPNANLYIENRLPDIELFRKNGCKITLGTDSLASNHQLNILEEIKTIKHHFPTIPLIELLQWATLNGAEFLGLEQKLGSFEKGKNPGVVLIENVDTKELLLTSDSTSQLIIPSCT
jgi:cytosine/adenosine deaminase-related metal-dependent hydrolase